MPSLLRLLDAISLGMFRLACVLVALIVFSVAYDVTSRNLGLPSAFWVVNSVEYAMLHITFLSLPYLVLTRGHVCVEVLLTYMRPALRRVWEQGLQVTSALICFYLSWHCGKSFLQAMADGLYDVRAFDAPMWMIYLTMPIGFALGGLQFLSFFAREQSFFGAPPETHAGM
ncbi:MAG: TRAP transporter small permease subunit [Hyphomicrobiaceae bacterium]|nr:TRAP transporter small permease subunit [Hyphomicrobiaceae bacterium]